MCKLWSDKTRPEIAQITMATDTHAPAMWRVNAQLGNFEDFYKTYPITKEDKMWVDEDKRLSIW